MVLRRPNRYDLWRHHPSYACLQRRAGPLSRAAASCDRVGRLAGEQANLPCIFVPRAPQLPGLILWQTQSRVQLQEALQHRDYRPTSFSGPCYHPSGFSAPVAWRLSCRSSDPDKCRLNRFRATPRPGSNPIGGSAGERRDDNFARARVPKESDRCGRSVRRNHRIVLSFALPQSPRLKPSVDFGAAEPRTASVFAQPAAELILARKTCRPALAQSINLPSGETRHVGKLVSSDEVGNPLGIRLRPLGAAIRFERSHSDTTVRRLCRSPGSF